MATSAEPNIAPPAVPKVGSNVVQTAVETAGTVVVTTAELAIAEETAVYVSTPAETATVDQSIDPVVSPTLFFPLHVSTTSLYTFNASLPTSTAGAATTPNEDVATN
jgi:hypothetical protein